MSSLVTWVRLLACAAIVVIAGATGSAFGFQDTAVQGEPSADDTEAAALFGEPSERDRRVSTLFTAGVSAWREGRHERAGELWREALEHLGPPTEPTSSDEVRVDRHSLLFNLGNAAFRAGRDLEAVGWYTAALTYAPRARETRDNLALARQRAGLAPLPAPGFVATLEGVATSFSLGEARWLALFGLVPLVVALLVEALRGGRKQALAAVVALLLALSASVPLLVHRLSEGSAPHMVVRAGGVELASEARGDAPRVAAAEAGEVVEVLDALPKWSFVERVDGSTGWVRASDLFALRR